MSEVLEPGDYGCLEEGKLPYTIGRVFAENVLVHLDPNRQSMLGYLGSIPAGRTLAKVKSGYEKNKEIMNRAAENLQLVRPSYRIVVYFTPERLS